MRQGERWGVCVGGGEEHLRGYDSLEGKCCLPTCLQGCQLHHARANMHINRQTRQIYSMKRSGLILFSKFSKDGLNWIVFCSTEGEMTDHPLWLATQRTIRAMIYAPICPLKEFVVRFGPCLLQWLWNCLLMHFRCTDLTVQQMKYKNTQITLSAIFNREVLGQRSGSV